MGYRVVRDSKRCDVSLSKSISSPFQIQLESTIRLSIWPAVLTHLVCNLIEVLRIPYRESVWKHEARQRFQQLFLKLERPFHEIFPSVVELFHRTVVYLE